jgi:RNA polymerase sigma-70 factor (ECF subfamily)
LLLEDQDRGRWDGRLIQRAQVMLALSAEGTVISRFHLEAAIAFHHCTASDVSRTDWPAILRLYEALHDMHDSPVYQINRAIALAQVEGPEAGIRLLDEARGNPALRHYHLFDAALGELHRGLGDLTRARQHLEEALRKASSPFDRELIERRLAQCASGDPADGRASLRSP